MSYDTAGTRLHGSVGWLSTWAVKQIEPLVEGFGVATRACPHFAGVCAVARPVIESR
jgi:hypothetical protein